MFCSPISRPLDIVQSNWSLSENYSSNTPVWIAQPGQQLWCWSDVNKFWGLSCQVFPPFSWWLRNCFIGVMLHMCLMSKLMLAIGLKFLGFLAFGPELWHQCIDRYNNLDILCNDKQHILPVVLLSAIFYTTCTLGCPAMIWSWWRITVTRDCGTHRTNFGSNSWALFHLSPKRMHLASTSSSISVLKVLCMPCVRSEALCDKFVKISKFRAVCIAINKFLHSEWDSKTMWSSLRQEIQNLVCVLLLRKVFGHNFLTCDVLEEGHE